MSRQVIVGGSKGGMSLSERFASLSQARASSGSQGHGHQSVQRSTGRGNDHGGRGGFKGKPSDRGVSKPQGQQQRRDDRQGGRLSRGGRGNANTRGGPKRGGNDARKPGQAKKGGEKKKPASAADLDKDLDNYFSRDPEKAKANLDDDLDAYMKQRDAAPAATQ